MKKWLRNTLLVGAFLAGSLGAKAQLYSQSLPSKREIRSELGTDNPSELNYLGQGYVTLEDKGKENYFNKIRLIDGINKKTVELENDGKRQSVYGPLTGLPSKKTLEEIDCIKKDGIITPKEISQTLDKKLENSFLDYASKTLGVPKEDVIQIGNGYVTSKALKEKLDVLSEVYEGRFKQPRKELYDMISGKDGVITDDEIISSAKIIKEYL